MTVDCIHVRFSDDGRNIRKWDFSPFEGGQAFVPAVEGFGSLAEASARAALRLTAKAIRDTADELRRDRRAAAREAADALVGIAEAVEEGLESTAADVVRAARAHMSAEAVNGTATVQ